MNRSGMTLVELLVAAAILLLILAMLAAGFISSSRAYETNRQTTVAAGQLRAAIEGLQYDLALAGFCGMQDACAFSDTPLKVITVHTDGVQVVSSITSSYKENRYTGGGEITMQVTYRVKEGKLVKSIPGQTEAVLADGIVRLVLVGYRSRTQPTAATQVLRPSGDDLSGVVLRLDYLHGSAVRSEEFTVPLRNSQNGGAI